MSVLTRSLVVGLFCPQEEDLRRSKAESSLSVKSSLKRFKQQMLQLDAIVAQLDAEEDAFATLVEQVEE